MINDDDDGFCTNEYGILIQLICCYQSVKTKIYFFNKKLQISRLFLQKFKKLFKILQLSQLSHIFSAKQIGY